MARYFALNSLAGCKRSSTSVVESTTASRFDSNYVANSIFIPGATTEYAEVGAPFMDGSTSLSTLYMRADFYAGNLASGTVLAMQLMGAGGANGYRLVNPNSTGTMEFQYWNSGTSAWVAWGARFNVTAATLYTLALKIVPGTSFEIYLGGALVTSGSSPTNAAAAITAVRFHGQFSGSGGPGMYWSQIMGADYDVRDAHYLSSAITGNSATNTSGTGSYTDVNETVLDEGTTVVLSAVGDKKGQTKAAVTVPSGYGIAGLVVNARGRVSGGTVSDGKLGVKSGSSSSSSTGRTYNGGFEPRGVIFEQDPATSGAWSQTSFNNAETYLEAA